MINMKFIFILFTYPEFVCPSIGFSEFLHLNYLKQILSWMKPNGCYGTMPAVKAKNISTFYSSMKFADYYDQAVNDGKFAKNDVKQTVFSVTVPKTKLKPNRPLLAEPSLQESAHKILKQKSSSVAASSLIKSFSNQHQDPFVQQMLAKSLRKNHAKLHVAHMGPAKSVASNTLNRVGLAPLLIQPNRTGLTVNATRQRNGPPPLIMEFNKAGSYAHQNGIKHHRKLLVEKVLSGKLYLVHILNLIYFKNLFENQNNLSSKNESVVFFFGIIHMVHFVIKNIQHWIKDTHSTFMLCYYLLFHFHYGTHNFLSLKSLRCI